MYHCEYGFFWDENSETCRECYEPVICEPGNASLSCKNLLDEYAVEVEMCGPCQNDLPANAHWTQLCDYECNETFFWDLLTQECKECKENGIHITCPNHQFFVSCSKMADARCDDCPISDNNAEFIDADTTCKTQCKDNYFLDDTDRCMPCTTLEELQAAVDVSNEAETQSIFYRFFACTKYSDSFARPCDEEREDGQYVAHSSQFNEDCTIVCYDNWQAGEFVLREYTIDPDIVHRSAGAQHISWNQSGCDPCANLINVPEENYRYNASCVLYCLNGWMLSDDTCIDCTASQCVAGQYMQLPLCDTCYDCEDLPEDASWVGVGVVNDSSSCPWQCNQGFFNEYSLGLCRPHTSRECNASQYKLEGNHLYDTMCEECSSCEGERLVLPCNDTDNSVCEPCPNDLKTGEIFQGIECEVVCDNNYVRNHTTNECELCDRQCPDGQYFPLPAENPTGCLDCRQCPPPPVSAGWEWLEGCEWACKPGLVYTQTFDDSTSQCVAENDNTVLVEESPMAVRCARGFKLNENFACVECSSIVQTPPQVEVGIKWSWSETGNPCTWTCTPPLIEYKPTGASLISCVEWSVYKRSIAIQKGLSISQVDNTAESSTIKGFETVQPATAIAPWHVSVAVAGVIALAMAIIYFK